MLRGTPIVYNKKQDITSMKEPIKNEQGDLVKIINPSFSSQTVNPFDGIMLEWSVSTIGRNWSIISEFLCNHPLTSGQQREIPKLQEQYAKLIRKKGKFFHKTMRFDPTQDDGIPILGRFKPYILMNRILPVYPQQYILLPDYLQKIKDNQLKIAGKRKMKYCGFSSYQIYDYKYKCTYEMDPDIIYVQR